MYVCVCLCVCKCVCVRAKVKIEVRSLNEKKAMTLQHARNCSIPGVDEGYFLHVPLHNLEDKCSC